MLTNLFQKPYTESNLNIVLINQWGGDQDYRARTESHRSWEYGRTQIVKWTTEGFAEIDLSKVRKDVRHTSVVRGMLVPYGAGVHIWSVVTEVDSSKVAPRFI